MPTLKSKPGALVKQVVASLSDAELLALLVASRHEMAGEPLTEADQQALDMWEARLTSARDGDHANPEK